LDLSVKYNTIPGQEVHVIGNIPELGNWKDEKVCKLQWTEGHIWKTIKPITTSKKFFQYKYILVQDGVRVAIESGIDRIADLELLAHDSKGQNVNFSQRRRTMTSGSQKFVRLQDEWEKVKIRFTVFHPKFNADDQMYLIADHRDLKQG